MKKTRLMMGLAVTVAFGSTMAAEGMTQRAAANATELRSVTGARSTASPTVVSGPALAGGKHAAQAREAYRPAAARERIDLAHAPRPVTASKDPNLESNWRANATTVQVAPLK